MAVGLVAACAVDNPLFGATESGGAEGDGTKADSGRPTTSVGPASGSTAVGGTMGDEATSNALSGTDAADDDDDDVDSDTEGTRMDMRVIDECRGLREFALAPGVAEHTPQAGGFDGGSRVFFFGDAAGTVGAATFPFVADPTIDDFPGVQGSMLLAGGQGVDLGVAADTMSLQLVLGDTDYTFGAPIPLAGMDLPHGGLAKVIDTWVVPTLSFDVFEVHTTTGAAPTVGYVEDTVVWVDGDGNDQGFAFVYERLPPEPTCRIVPFTSDESFGSNSAAASGACHTPTIAYDPGIGGLMVYARESPAEIRGIRIDADADAIPDQTQHFPILVGKGVDHPEVVRLPVSGDFWIVFDQGAELTAVVLDGEDPTANVGAPKTFGGQANGNLQAFLVEDHPAVAFHTNDPAYGAGVHVVVDCDVI